MYSSFSRSLFFSSFILLTALITGCGKSDDSFEGVATYNSQMVMMGNRPMKQVLYFKGTKVKGEVGAGTPSASYFLADYTKDSIQYFHPPQDSRTMKMAAPIASGDTLLKYLGKDEKIGQFNTKLYEAPIRMGLRVRMYLTKDLPDDQRHAIGRSLAIGTSQSSDNQARINSQVRKMDMIPVRIQVLQDTAKLMETNFVSVEAKSLPDSVFTMPKVSPMSRPMLP